MESLRLRNGLKTPDVYLRGCWMLFCGFCWTTTGGLGACAAWCCSIDDPFVVGLEETMAVSSGLFWFNPMISTGSLWGARSVCVVLCWTILIPPAFTTTSFRWRRRSSDCEIVMSWIRRARNNHFARKYIPAGARPATFCFDSSSDIVNACYLIYFLGNAKYLFFKCDSEIFAS